MSHKKRKPTKDNAIQRELFTPLYRMRVEKDKTKYNRKAKHRSKDYFTIIINKLVTIVK